MEMVWELMAMLGHGALHQGGQLTQSDYLGGGLLVESSLCCARMIRVAWLPCDVCSLAIQRAAVGMLILISVLRHSDHIIGSHKLGVRDRCELLQSFHIETGRVRTASCSDSDL